jgi:hypothetical protein
MYDDAWAEVFRITISLGDRIDWQIEKKLEKNV